jgi:hypothetical protein
MMAVGMVGEMVACLVAMLVGNLVDKMEIPMAAMMAVLKEWMWETRRVVWMVDVLVETTAAWKVE